MYDHDGIMFDYMDTEKGHETLQDEEVVIRSRSKEKGSGMKVGEIMA